MLVYAPPPQGARGRGLPQGYPPGTGHTRGPPVKQQFRGKGPLLRGKGPLLIRGISNGPSRTRTVGTTRLPPVAEPSGSLIGRESVPFMERGRRKSAARQLAGGLFYRPSGLQGSE